MTARQTGNNRKRKTTRTISGEVMKYRTRMARKITNFRHDHRLSLQQVAELLTSYAPDRDKSVGGEAVRRWEIGRDRPIGWKLDAIEAVCRFNGKPGPNGQQLELPTEPDPKPGPAVKPFSVQLRRGTLTVTVESNNPDDLGRAVGVVVSATQQL